MKKDYCDVLKMILTGKGYKVDTCGNGQEAVEKLEKKSFDLVNHGSVHAGDGRKAAAGRNQKKGLGYRK